MKAYKKLDKTLDYLIANKDPYGQQSSEIHKNLNIAQDQVEQHLVLEKLVEDGYTIVNVPKNGKSGKEYRNNPLYIINFNGMLFKENGAYELEYAIRQRELITRKLLSWLNPTWRVFGFIGTIVAIIYGVFRIYKDIIYPILNT